VNEDRDHHIIKDDKGHAPLIEKNVRAAGINNAIVAFIDGSGALRRYIYGRGLD
jgi:hypothetical protein